MRLKVRWLILFIWFVSANDAYAIDLSGEYDCIGDDAHEGKYTGKVIMKLRPEYSHGDDASYDFQLSVPDYGIYNGHAAVHGMTAAMHFALPSENGVYGGKTHDFGTGIALFKKDKLEHLSFRKFYFEPEFKGGNTGVEICIRQ